MLCQQRPTTENAIFLRRAHFIRRPPPINIVKAPNIRTKKSTFTIQLRRYKCLIINRLSYRSDGMLVKAGTLTSFVYGSGSVAGTITVFHHTISRTTSYRLNLFNSLRIAIRNGFAQDWWKTEIFYCMFCFFCYYYEFLHFFFSY